MIRLTAQYSRLSTGLLAVVVLSVAPMPLAAQGGDLPQPVIAVVNVEAILREAAAAASIRQQIDDYTVEFQAIIDEERSKLEAEGTEIQEQRTLLAPEAFTQRRQEWQQNNADLQEYVKAVRRVMSESMRRASQRVETALSEEIGKLAEERGFNLVLNRAQALYAADALDLTEAALSRLNERLPDVPIVIEKVEKTESRP